MKQFQVCSQGCSHVNKVVRDFFHQSESQRNAEARAHSISDWLSSVNEGLVLPDFSNN